tara:strand:+ start:443 stop:571 length:129 start_codon:yes stop_codon:yes gene_type:complete
LRTTSVAGIFAVTASQGDGRVIALEGQIIGPDLLQQLKTEGS